MPCLLSSVVFNLKILEITWSDTLTDVFSKEKRSEIMSRIGPKNTKPELIIRRLVHSLGYRYRLHKKDLPGKPDLVFPKYRKVIFVHGCFWHGCEKCNRSKLPDTNYDFWNLKIRKTKDRDRRIYAELKKIGWDSLVLWQCEIKSLNTNRISAEIIDFLGTETASN